MPKEAVFTMKLEPELRTEFMAEARKYDDFLLGKVELARAQIANRLTATHEEVQARVQMLSANFSAFFKFSG